MQASSLYFTPARAHSVAWLNGPFHLDVSVDLKQLLTKLCDRKVSGSTHSYPDSHAFKPNLA